MIRGAVEVTKTADGKIKVTTPHGYHISPIDITDANIDGEGALWNLKAEDIVALKAAKVTEPIPLPVTEPKTK